MTAPNRDWSTVTCKCGHSEVIDPDREYHVVPTGRYRLRADPATSSVSAEEEHRYICDPCWEALPTLVACRCLMSPESPQDHSVPPVSGTGTSGEGQPAVTARSEPVSGAFPDVRLLPDGRVARRIPGSERSNPYEWLVTITAKGQVLWARADQLPLSDAERLVPAGPLLELAGHWEQIRDEYRVRGDSVLARVFDVHAHLLRDRLASLLGESPEPVQEGNHD